MTECERIIAEGHFKQEFLLPETRDNFYISDKMKKVWLIELDLLKHLLEICAAGNLRCWVGFGSLLGAVRHKGFIPWDDDLDVWMPREDYEKLLKLPDNAFVYPYFLQTTLNDTDYYCSFARLRNSETTGVLVSHHNKCNNGIYIDIYPLDILNRKSGVNLSVLSRNHIMNVMTHAFLYNVNPSIITRTLHKILRLPFIKFNVNKVYQQVNKNAMAAACKGGDEIGLLVFRAYPPERITYLLEDFLSTNFIQFENILVPIPRGYDRILKTLYGNYMQFPPLKNRGEWHHFLFEPDIPYRETYKLHTDRNIGE